MKCKKLIVSLCFLVMAFLVKAQQDPAIVASTDKNRILIGEQLKLTIEAIWPTGSPFPGIIFDSIPHFEIIGKPILDTLRSDGGMSVKGVYILTSFDSGHWVIPSFSLTKMVKSDTLPVDVVFSDFDTNQDYHEIKDIMEVAPPKKKWPWGWYAGAGLLLLLAGIFYLNRKKKPKILAETEIVSDPFEEAMKKLDSLSKNRTDAKQFHSVLTAIFRHYIFRKKGIQTLQNTTDDLLVQLKKLNLDKVHFDQLSQSLLLSDFVKFARYKPVENESDFCLETIADTIKRIEHSGA